MRVKPISGFYIDLKKSEKYSKVEECNMSTNCVGTYEQYKERYPDMSDEQIMSLVRECQMYGK